MLCGNRLVQEADQTDPEIYFSGQVFFIAAFVEMLEIVDI